MLQYSAIIDPKIESLYKGGFLIEAQDLLAPAYERAIATSNFVLALTYLKMITRIHIELETHKQLDNIFSQVQSNPDFHKYCSTQSKYYFCYSIYDFSKNLLTNSIEQIEQAVHYAFTENDLEDLTHALLAKVKLTTNKKSLDFQSLHGQMEKLDLLLTKTNNIDLRVLFYLQDSEIALLEGKQDLCIEKAWLAYTTSKRSASAAVYAISVFAVLGYAYFHKKDFTKAAVYLQVAKKSIEPTSLLRTLRIVDALLQQCPTEETGYDYLLDMNEKKVKFKSKNEIDLKNQFVLIDMIKLFFEQNDSPISKNQLVEKIWNESYDPSRHDNLIYVTIKRLRTLLKENENDDDLIVRSKKGYSLKPGTVAVIR